MQSFLAKARKTLLGASGRAVCGAQGCEGESGRAVWVCVMEGLGWMGGWDMTVPCFFPVFIFPFYCLTGHFIIPSSVRTFHHLHFIYSKA